MEAAAPRLCGRGVRGRKGTCARPAAVLMVVLLLARETAPAGASPGGALRQPLQRLGAMYGTALSRHPILTHVAQGASISGVCVCMCVACTHACVRACMCSSERAGHACKFMHARAYLLRHCECMQYLSLSLSLHVHALARVRKCASMHMSTAI